MMLASPAVGGCGATGRGAFGLASAFGSGVVAPAGAGGGAAESSVGGTLATGSGAPIVVAISLLSNGSNEAKPSVSLVFYDACWKSKKPPFAIS